MREFHTKQEIDAPCIRVWQVLADLERWPEWTESMAEVELLDDDLPKLGTRVRIRQPKLRSAIWTITDWQPERRFVWVTRSLGVEVVAEHNLSPSPTGCSLALKLIFRGLLGGIVGTLTQKLIRHYMELEAAGAKTRSEQPLSL